MTKKRPAFQFSLTDLTEDFEKILLLNRLNNIERLDSKLWASEGFLTTKYDIHQLERMRGAYKHVVAKHQGDVIGYALVLLREDTSVSPYPDTIFEFVDANKVNDKCLKNIQYFVMTQICVDKNFRGMGVFKALYKKLSEQMSTNFEKVVIKVSGKNIRSLNAHQNIGFKIIENQNSGKELEGWNIMVCDLK